MKSAKKTKFPRLEESLSASRAAEIALVHQSDRLRTSLAKSTENEGVESVHQLRVSARRLSATLKAFRDRLPTKLGKKLAKRTRALRQAAGEVRDLDVLIDLVEQETKEASSAEKSLFEDFRSHLKRRRGKRSAELREKLTSEHRKSFWKKLPSALSEISEDPEKIRTIAPRLLRDRVDALSGAWNPALGGDDVKLHELRIAFKNLRYTLDLFRGYYQESFPEPLYRDLEKSQEKLGAIHDDHVLLERLTRFARKRKQKAELALVENRLQEKLADKKRDWFHFMRNDLGKSQLALLPPDAVSN